VPESREPVDDLLKTLETFGLRRAPEPSSSQIVTSPDYSGARSDAELAS
jgi:hypothetical protein